jgi:hypothetical protein
MGTRAWGRRALPVASPLTRDVSTALLAGELGVLLASAAMMVLAGPDPLRPLQLMGAFVVGDAALQDGVAAIGAAFLGLLFVVALPGFLWSVVFGMSANLLRARCGRPLIGLVLGMAVVALAVDSAIAPVWLRLAVGHDVWHDTVPWGAVVVWHVILAAMFLLFPVLYTALWGSRPYNWYRMRRYDPIDPLGM